MKLRTLLTVAIATVLLSGCISPRTEQLTSQCADIRTVPEKEAFLKVAQARLEYIDARDSFPDSLILRIRDPGVWTHVGLLRECTSNLRR